MKLIINGEEHLFAQPPATLEALFAALSIPAARTAVELNGSVIEQHTLGATPLQDGDRVEIVSFVGGG